MSGKGALNLSGEVALKVVPKAPTEAPSIYRASVADVLRHGLPQRGETFEVNEWRSRNLRHLWRGVRDVRRARRSGAPVLLGFLHLTKILRDGARVHLGLANARVVTTAGVGFIVDAFQDLTELELMRFHAIGTGTTAEAVGDTALLTELTTQYNPDNTRATGTLAEGASGNVFRTVGTNTVDAAVAITEHGILSQAAVGGGVLLDRSVFAAVNLGSGESLQSTYDLTISAGS